LVTVLRKCCLLKHVIARKVEVKTAADGKTMEKMKAATGLTYVDGTFFDSGVFMASKVLNLIVLVVNSVRIWNVAHSLKEPAAFLIILQ